MFPLMFLDVTPFVWEAALWEHSLVPLLCQVFSPLLFRPCPHCAHLVPLLCNPCLLSFFADERHNRRYCCKTCLHGHIANHKIQICTRSLWSTTSPPPLKKGCGTGSITWDGWSIIWFHKVYKLLINLIKIPRYQDMKRNLMFKFNILLRPSSDKTLELFLDFKTCRNCSQPFCSYILKIKILKVKIYSWNY